jgi:hypothetical protein
MIVKLSSSKYKRIINNRLRQAQADIVIISPIGLYKRITGIISHLG